MLRSLFVSCLGLAACAPGTKSGPARNAVLITLDTTRADALGVYGSPAPTTPHLDRLAGEGVVFDRARSVAPLTLPAHASMMTGLYPPRHGVRVNGGSVLPAGAETLAERARAAGIETAAFLAAVVLDRRTGLGQGFERYDETPHGLESSGVMGRRSASAVVDAALAWLDGRDASRRFLLWVHLFDPHAPYRPPARFLGQGQGNPYLGEVASADAELGRLFERLERDGLLGDTVILVVGDHGEDLEEHGEPTHAVYCYDSTIRVPFLLRRPGGAGGGVRSDAVVSVIDVAPTLAEALGLAPLAGLDGLSLWTDGVPAGRGVYFETYHGFVNYGWSPLAGWADADTKYLHSPSPELYELAADPGERTNRFEGGAERTSDAREAIARVTAAPSLAGGEATPGEVLQGLEQLGYTMSGAGARDLPDPLAVTTRPAPAARLQELRDILRAEQLADGGRVVEAAAIFQQIVDANPLNVAALDGLGATLGRLERWPEAVVVLERCRVLTPDRVVVLANLALGCEATGDLEAAVRYGRRALELDPGHQMARLNLERALGRLGRQ